MKQKAHTPGETAAFDESDYKGAMHLALSLEKQGLGKVIETDTGFKFQPNRGATSKQDEPAPKVRLTAASKVRTTKVNYLLEGIIPLGVIALISGKAGEGKSSLALHWAARATRGELPGKFHGTPVSVLISALEDSQSVQKNRLIAAGADLLPAVFLDVVNDVAGDEFETRIQFPRDLEAIKEAILATGAKLWIIDPITNLVPGDTNKRDDVRKALDPLHGLARELDIAILGIAHMGKGSGQSGDKISGSHAWRDVVRAHIPLVWDKESGHRVYTLEKANYSTENGKSWKFDLIDTQVETDDGSIAHVGRVVELGVSDTDVDEIINRQPETESHGNDAQEFILDYLTEEGGEAVAGDVLKAGAAAGFTRDEIKNARKRSKNPRIESRKATRSGAGKGSPWVWAIVVEEGTETHKGVTSENMTPSQSEPTGNRWNDAEKVKVAEDENQSDTLMSDTFTETPLIDPVKLDGTTLGTVIGTHPKYGSILYTKRGLVPADTAPFQAWNQDGQPDLLHGLDGAA